MVTNTTLNTIAQVAGIGGTSPVASGSVELFPNPAYEMVNVEFDLDKSATVEIAVYDVLGREVATLGKSARAEGSHRVSIDVSSWTDGVYLLSIKTENSAIGRHFTVGK